MAENISIDVRGKLRHMGDVSVCVRVTPMKWESVGQEIKAKAIYESRFIFPAQMDAGTAILTACRGDILARRKTSVFVGGTKHLQYFRGESVRYGKHTDKWCVIRLNQPVLAHLNACFWSCLIQSDAFVQITVDKWSFYADESQKIITQTILTSKTWWILNF